MLRQLNRRHAFCHVRYLAVLAPSCADQPSQRAWLLVRARPRGATLWILKDKAEVTFVGTVVSADNPTPQEFQFQRGQVIPFAWMKLFRQ
jgi:hypothetical protein